MPMNLIDTQGQGVDNQDQDNTSVAVMSNIEHVLQQDVVRRVPWSSAHDASQPSPFGPQSSDRADRYEQGLPGPGW